VTYSNAALIATFSSLLVVQCVHDSTLKAPKSRVTKPEELQSDSVLASDRRKQLETALTETRNEAREAQCHVMSLWSVDRAQRRVCTSSSGAVKYYCLFNLHRQSTCPAFHARNSA